MAYEKECCANLTVDTRFPSIFHFVDVDRSVSMSSLQYHFANQGQYKVSINSTTVEVKVTTAGRNEVRFESHAHPILRAYC